MTKRYGLRGSKINFEVHASGGPIDSPDTAADLFKALGHASAAWARMELMLAAILMHINKVSESAEFYNRDFPISFKAKLELMKTWLAHPSLAQHKDIFRKTLIILKDLSKHRNEFLHSDVRSFDPRTGQFTIATLQSRGNDTFNVREVDFDIIAVTTLANLSRTATLALSEMMDLLTTTDSAP